MALRSYSEATGKPLHASAAELIDRGLRQEQSLEKPPAAEQHPSAAPGEGSNGEHSGAIPAAEPGDNSTIPGKESTNQMDLFGG